MIIITAYFNFPGYLCSASVSSRICHLLLHWWRKSCRQLGINQSWLRTELRIEQWEQRGVADSEYSFFAQHDVCWSYRRRLRFDAGSHWKF